MYLVTVFDENGERVCDEECAPEYLTGLIETYLADYPRVEVVKV